MALIVCLGGKYVLEQPKQSLLPRHKRVRWLTTVSRVTSFVFWTAISSESDILNETWNRTLYLKIIVYIYCLALHAPVPRSSEFPGTCITTGISVRSLTLHLAIPGGLRNSTAVP